MIAEGYVINIDPWTIAKVSPVAAAVVLLILYRKQLWAHRKGFATLFLTMALAIPGVGGVYKLRLAQAESVKKQTQEALPGPWFTLYEEMWQIKDPTVRAALIESFIKNHADLPPLASRGLSLLVQSINNKKAQGVWDPPLVPCSQDRCAEIAQAISKYIDWEISPRLAKSH